MTIHNNVQYLPLVIASSESQFSAWEDMMTLVTADFSGPAWDGLTLDQLGELRWKPRRHDMRRSETAMVTHPVYSCPL